MPGAPLSPYDIPTISNSLQDFINQTSACLQTLKTDIEAKVVAAEIDVNGNLSFNGWQLRDVNTVLFESVADPDEFPAGAIVYSSGEWWMVTGDGAIQITLNGLLNAAGFGAIVGSGYGVNGAFVTFNDTNDSYEFTAGPNLWADIEVDDVVLKGALGSTRLSCHSSLASAVTLNFNVTLPGTGSSPLTVDSTGAISKGGWSNSIVVTGGLTLDGVGFIADNGGTITVRDDATPEYTTVISTLAANYAQVFLQGPTSDALRLRQNRLDLQGSTDIHREMDYETTILPGKGHAYSDFTQVIPQDDGVRVLLGGNFLRVPFPLLVGERLLDFKVSLSTVGGAGSVTVRVRVVNGDGTTAATLYNAAQATTSTQTMYTLNITDHTLLTGQSVEVRLQCDNTRDTIVGTCAFIHDRP